MSLQKWHLLIQYYKLQVTLRPRDLIWIHRTATKVFYIHVIRKNGTTTGLTLQDQIEILTMDKAVMKTV